MLNNRKRAFTLVELVVVILILSILWTIAFISLVSYSKTSRDSVRISDVSSVRTSLELFHINAGKYPLPDDNEIVSYEGDSLRYQWNFWDTVISNLSRSISKVPVDPLIEKSYIYSVANNKNEFEILSLLEWDNLALNTIAQAEAATLIVTPKIDGTYNGIFIKTPNFIVPVPSIVTSEDITWGLALNANNIRSQVVDWWDNVPGQWNVITSTWWLTGLVLSVYTWSLDSTSIDQDKIDAMEKIQSAYSWSSLANEGLYTYILEQTTPEQILAVSDIVVFNDFSSIVIDNNESPVAPALSNQTWDENVAISTVTLAEFTDTEWDTLTYTVTWLPTGLSFNPATREITWTPTVINTFTVSYTANDWNNTDVTTTFDYTINSVVNNPPVAPALSNQTWDENVAITTITLAEFTDTEWDTLTYTVTWLPTGLSFNPATREITWTPTVVNIFTVTYTANDGTNPDVSDTFNYTINTLVNNSPVAPALSNQTWDQNVAISTLTLPVFTDTEWDTLTYSVSGLPTGLSFNPATREITWTPSVSGSFTVTYTANDGVNPDVNANFNFSLWVAWISNWAWLECRSVSAGSFECRWDSWLTWNYWFRVSGTNCTTMIPVGTYVWTISASDATCWSKLNWWAETIQIIEDFWGSPSYSTSLSVTIPTINFWSTITPFAWWFSFDFTGGWFVSETSFSFRVYSYTCATTFPAWTLTWYVDASDTSCWSRLNPWVETMYLVFDKWWTNVLSNAYSITFPNIDFATELTPFAWWFSFDFTWSNFIPKSAFSFRVYSYTCATTFPAWTLTWYVDASDTSCWSRLNPWVETMYLVFDKWWTNVLSNAYSITFPNIDFATELTPFAWWFSFDFTWSNFIPKSDFSFRVYSYICATTFPAWTLTWYIDASDTSCWSRLDPWVETMYLVFDKWWTNVLSNAYSITFPNIDFATELTPFAWWFSFDFTWSNFIPKSAFSFRVYSYTCATTFPAWTLTWYVDASDTSCWSRLNPWVETMYLVFDKWWTNVLSNSYSITFPAIDFATELTPFAWWFSFDFTWSNFIPKSDFSFKVYNYTCAKSFSWGTMTWYIDASDTSCWSNLNPWVETMYLVFDKWWTNVLSNSYSITFPNIDFATELTPFAWWFSFDFTWSNFIPKSAFSFRVYNYTCATTFPAWTLTWYIDASDTSCWSRLDPWVETMYLVFDKWWTNVLSNSYSITFPNIDFATELTPFAWWFSFDFTWSNFIPKSAFSFRVYSYTCATTFPAWTLTWYVDASDTSCWPRLDPWVETMYLVFDKWWTNVLSNAYSITFPNIDFATELTPFAWWFSFDFTWSNFIPKSDFSFRVYSYTCATTFPAWTLTWYVDASDTSCWSNLNPWVETMYLVFDKWWTNVLSNSYSITFPTIDIASRVSLFNDWFIFDFNTWNFLPKSDYSFRVNTSYCTEVVASGSVFWYINSSDPGCWAQLTPWSKTFYVVFDKGWNNILSNWATVSFPSTGSGTYEYYITY